MRDSSWQGGVTFGTSAAFRRHVGPLPSARGGPPFSCVGNDVYARRSPMTNHNDKHGTTCAAAHELFARKLVYRVIMPTFVLCILSGQSVEEALPSGEENGSRSSYACHGFFLRFDYSLDHSRSKVRPLSSAVLISEKKNRACSLRPSNLVSFPELSCCLFFTS